MMMLRTLETTALVSVILALGCAGCSEDKEKGTKAAKESAAFHLPLLEKITAAGLKPTGFENAAARPYHAKQCFRGEVDQLEVLICQYSDGAAAVKSQGTLDSFLAGAMSGAARVKATTALAVADRKKVDIKGEKINQLLSTFSAPD